MSSSNSCQTPARRPTSVAGAGRPLSRRAACGLLAGLFAAGLAEAHTPYKQWVVYRKKHLLIGTDKSVKGSYPLGKRLAAVLAEKLPESQARVARAPNSTRIASLLATGQLDVALLPTQQAVALAQGQPPFAPYEAMELRSLFASGDFLLVCRPDFSEEHAYLVTSTLAHYADEAFASTAEPPIPLHPGSRAFLLDR
jgi:TRAP-type uncharacterized transport system substrate-binding protein